MKQLCFKFITFVFLSTLMLTGYCQTKPEDVITEYVTSIAKGDTEKVISLIGAPVLDDNQKAAMTANLLKAKEIGFDPRKGLKSVPILDTKIAEDGLHGYVKFRIIYNNGENHTLTMKVINIDNQWKLDLSH